MPKVIIVGGGINGLCTAISCAEAGYEVALFDRGKIAEETSAKSSRMLHGGIRYLEQGHLSLVRRALVERKRWLDDFPDAVKTTTFLVIPNTPSLFNKLRFFIGVKLYQWLAGSYSLGSSGRLETGSIPSALDHLRSSNHPLYYYVDTVMDDRAIVGRLLAKANDLGVEIQENHNVEHIASDHIVAEVRHGADVVVNMSGPWVSQTLAQSNLESSFHLRYIRGAHLVLNPSLDIGSGALFEQPDGRVVFLVPSPNGLLWGTTEFEQEQPSVSSVFSEDIDYLKAAYKAAFKCELSDTDIIDSFAGVRPIVASGDQMSKASRKAEIVDNGVISMYGGKWTSARANARSALEIIKAHCNS